MFSLLISRNAVSKTGAHSGSITVIIAKACLFFFLCAWEISGVMFPEHRAVL